MNQKEPGAINEDVELTSAVANTCKKNHGNEHRKDWVAFAKLVPRRTKFRWRTLDPSIDRKNGRKG